MQKLSHTTRAYIFNPQANGLSGFVFSFDPMKILKAAEKYDLERV